MILHPTDKVPTAVFPPTQPPLPQQRKKKTKKPRNRHHVRRLSINHPFPHLAASSPLLSHRCSTYPSVSLTLCTVASSPVFLPILSLILMAARPLAEESLMTMFKGCDFCWSLDARVKSSIFLAIAMALALKKKGALLPVVCMHVCMYGGVPY